MKLKIVVIDLEIPPRVKKWGLRLGIPLGLLLGGGAIAWAAGLHTWKDGEPLNATDLNGNFTQLQNEIAAVPPITDQSVSGYLRIGSVQICWGTATTPGSPGFYNLMFPQPFLDTSYSLSVTPAMAGQNATYAITGTPQKGQAVIQCLAATNDTGTNCTLQWMAVGRWQ